MNINESMFLVVGASFFAFTNPSDDQTKISMIGNVIMGIIMLVLSLNIAVLTLMKARLVSKVQSLSFHYLFFFYNPFMIITIGIL